MWTWAVEISGTRIVHSASRAITRWTGIGRRTNSGRRPVTRATRRTASPNDRISGPRTAIVRSESRGVAQGRRHQDPRDVVDGDRADWLFAKADEPEHRERVERVAEVVEHVVATTVDDAGLEDSVA